MDYSTHVEKQFETYLALCKQPPWKAWAWHQVKDMARKCPDLYGQLPDRIEKAMKQQENPK